MKRTTPSRTRRASLVLASLTLALPACRSGTSAGTGDDPALAAIQSRIPPLPATELGAAPGFLGGGLVYLAVRPGKAQAWLQALPLGEDIVRDLARLGNELGFDPRIDDVVARLGLDPDAPISATLMRPLGDAATVRAMLERGTTLPPDPFPGLGVTPSDLGPSPRDYDRMQPPPAPRPPPPQPPQPLEPPHPIEPIEPIAVPTIAVPPVPVKPTVEQGTLARAAGSLGTHSRVFVPVKDLALTLAPLRRLGDKTRPPELESLCSALGPSELCVGSSGELLLVRASDNAVAVDIFVFTAGTGAAFDAERVAAVKAALGAPIASLPVLASLRGDFMAYADADAVPALQETLSIAQAAGSLRWSPDIVRDHLAQSPALAQLRETRRLFAGARLEVVLAGDVMQATFQWEPRDDAARAVLGRLLTRTPAAASVPTISGLCDGSLVCMRTAGLPAVSGFDELAVGIYARPEAELMRVIDDADDLGALTLFLETWPNFFGAAQRWSREQGGRMETVMLGQALEAVGRIEGLGGSLRSLHVRGGDTTGDFIGYMRMHGQDLVLMRSLLGFAGIRFAPATLPQVPGKVEATRIPDSGIPASLYIVTDPGTVRAGDRDIEAGWAMIADSDDRLTWMIGLERSAAVTPAFYFELPDLWRLLGADDNASRDLNFAQTWLTGRSVRIAADVIDGRLRLDFQLAKTTATTPALAK